MPALLPQTFKEVATLPGEQQEAFVKWVIEELKDENDWRVALDKSMCKLAEFQAKTRPFEPIQTQELCDSLALH